MDLNGGQHIDAKYNVEATVIDDTVSAGTTSISATIDNHHDPKIHKTKTKHDAIRHPKWLRIFMKPKMFIATLCCFSLIQGFVINGLNNANTTTYEKRFFLLSSEVGAISSTYDFVGGILAIPISYFGAHAHKPRLLAVMALVFGLGSFIMLLPHVISDVYDYGQGTTHICNIEGNVTSCAESTDASLPRYLYILCLGMAFHGIAGASLYSIGIATIDECVTQQAATFALSLMYAAGSLGPALGFIIGGQFLKIYVDADVLDSDSVTLSELDPRWIGAWWIGFIISVVLITLQALILFIFPRRIPVSDEVLKSRIDQSQEGLAEEVKKPGFGTSIRDLPRATLNLLKNMPFMFTTLAGISDGFIVIGFATFLPKVIEQQFNKSASVANLVFGAVVVGGGVGGQLVGGYVCKRAKLKVRGMLIWSASCAILTAMLTAVFWLHCDDAPIAGVNRAYGNGSIDLSTVNTEAGCNARCQCSSRVHAPVCGEDNVEYFTPCHAGCREEETINIPRLYYNCSCVQLTLGGSGSDTARAGRCDNGSCTEFYVAMVLLFLLIFTLLLDWAPRVSITLRCVPDSQRTYSLGIQALFVRLLGTVPAPIVFGAVLDIACKHHRMSCDGVEVCSIYDRYLLSRNTFLLAFFFKVLTAVLYTFALLQYKPPKSVDDSNGSRRDGSRDGTNGVEIDVVTDSAMDGVLNKPQKSVDEANGSRRDGSCDGTNGMEIDVVADSAMDGVINKGFDDESDVRDEQSDDIDSTDI